MWPWRELDDRKPRRHTGHLWGLLEAWVFMWILRWSLREKAESHSPQWYFLSPVCSFTWRSRLRLCLNRRLQKVQLKGSLSPWLCSWRLRKLRRLKDLSQNWHGVLEKSGPYWRGTMQAKSTKDHPQYLPICRGNKKGGWAIGGMPSSTEGEDLPSLPQPPRVWETKSKKNDPGRCLTVKHTQRIQSKWSTGDSQQLSTTLPVKAVLKANEMPARLRYRKWIIGEETDTGQTHRQEHLVTVPESSVPGAAASQDTQTNGGPEQGEKRPRATKIDRQWRAGEDDDSHPAHPKDAEGNTNEGAALTYRLAALLFVLLD
ncbi:hypothetical protein CRUP_021272, partial [Coryphaenoides rupestris]